MPADNPTQQKPEPFKEQKVDICVKCGHLKLSPWRGYCKHETSPFGKRPVTYCGCVCEFPAATPAPVVEQEYQIAVQFLSKNGYARCVSAECGCNSWHIREDVITRG